MSLIVTSTLAYYRTEVIIKAKTFYSSGIWREKNGYQFCGMISILRNRVSPSLKLEEIEEDSCLSSFSLSPTHSI